MTVHPDIAAPAHPCARGIPYILYIKKPRAGRGEKCVIKADCPFTYRETNSSVSGGDCMSRIQYSEGQPVKKSNLILNLFDIFE